MITLSDLRKELNFFTVYPRLHYEITFHAVMKRLSGFCIIQRQTK